MIIEVASEVVRTSKYVVIGHVAVLGLKVFVVFRSCSSRPMRGFPILHENLVGSRREKCEIGICNMVSLTVSPEMTR